MFAFLPLTGGKANSRLRGLIMPMIRALGPGSVSSFLKAILDVSYFLLMVAVAVVAAIILGLLLISFDPHVLPAGLGEQIRVEGQPPGALAALLLFGRELYLFGVIVIVQRLRKIFAALIAGDPFHPDNVRRLRVTALFMALLEIDGYVFGAIGRFATQHAPFAHISINLTPWFAVLVVLVLAEVFREGARLRRDAELTI